MKKALEYKNMFCRPGRVMEFEEQGMIVGGGGGGEG